MSRLGEEKKVVFSTVRGSCRGPLGDCQEPWTGRDGKNAVHTRPGNLRTAIIVEDGESCKVRQIRVGDFRRPQMTMGDYVSILLTALPYTLPKQAPKFIE